MRRAVSDSAAHSLIKSGSAWHNRPAELIAIAENWLEVFLRSRETAPNSQRRPPPWLSPRRRLSGACFEFFLLILGAGDSKNGNSITNRPPETECCRPAQHRTRFDEIYNLTHSYETAFFGQIGDGVMTEDKLEPIFTLLGVPFSKQAARVSLNSNNKSFN